jgi:serine protease AprX
VKGTALIAVGFAVGCAQAGKSDQITVVDGPDGMIYLDAPGQHGPPDDGMGSGSGSGSAACTPMQLELLKNPAFDLAPVGTMWTQAPYDPAYPLVTADVGIAQQSAPDYAWMGGLAATDYGASTVSDTLYQDIAVPATATTLVLTGYYELRTADSTTIVYDKASLSLAQTNGTVIEPVYTEAQLNNTHATTTWTAINHTFTNVSAGQTVRLLFSSNNDITLATSFYFDSLSLKAMACP